MKNLYLLTLLSVFTLAYCNTPAKTSEPANTMTETKNTELIGTHWKLIELNGQPVTNPVGNQKEAFIMFAKEENRISGSGGCNMLMGAYELMDGNRLKFSGIASTMMACPDMSMERQLNNVFDSTDNYAISGKILSLHKAKMAPLARFEAQ